MKSITRSSIASLVALATAASVTHAQSAPHARSAELQRYEIFLVQPATPGSTAYTSATSVNDLGLVTGTSSTGAFLWSAASGAVELAEGQSGFSSARDVNLLGMVAGSLDTAALWTAV